MKEMFKRIHSSRQFGMEEEHRKRAVVTYRERGAHLLRPKWPSYEGATKEIAC